MEREPTEVKLRDGSFVILSISNGLSLIFDHKLGQKCCLLVRQWQRVAHRTAVVLYANEIPIIGVGSIEFQYYPPLLSVNNDRCQNDYNATGSE